MKTTLWHGLVRKGARMFFDDIRLTALVVAWILVSCWLATSRLAVPVRAVAVFAGFATILVATTLGAARRSTSSSDGRCETTADHHSR